jgi:hypothetical protein
METSMHADENRWDGIDASSLSPSAAQSMALRPGEPLSNSSFGGATCERFLSCAGSDKAVDLLSLIHFSDADQEGIFQLGIVTLQSDAGDDFLRRAFGEKLRQIVRPQNEFIEERRGKRRAKSLLPHHLSLRIMSTGDIDFSNTAQSRFAQQCHVHIAASAHRV